MRPSRFSIGLVIGLSCTLAPPARAQTWIGSSNTNWAGGIAPVNDGTADVVFTGGAAFTASVVSTPYSINSLLFDALAPGYSTGDNGPLILNGGGLTNFAAGPSFAGPIVAAANQTWTTTAARWLGGPAAPSRSMPTC